MKLFPTFIANQRNPAECKFVLTVRRLDAEEIDRDQVENRHERKGYWEHRPSLVIFCRICFKNISMENSFSGEKYFRDYLERRKLGISLTGQFTGLDSTNSCEIKQE